MNVESKSAITARVRCQGQLHTITVDDDQLVLDDHDHEPLSDVLDAARAAADVGRPGLIRCGQVHLAWQGAVTRRREGVQESLRALSAPLRAAHTDLTRSYVEAALVGATYRRRAAHETVVTVSGLAASAAGGSQRNASWWEIKVGRHWIGAVYRRLGTGLVQGQLILECHGDGDDEFLTHAVKQSRGYGLRVALAAVSTSGSGALQLKWLH